MTAETLLDIDQVNQLTGLPQATLRNWEKRYGFPRPQRSQGGHRLYDVEEVHKLRAVVQLYKNGAKVRDAIEQVLGGTSSNTQAENDSARDAQNLMLNEGLDQVLSSLYRYDDVAAAELLSRIGMRLNEKDLLEMVYPQLLMRVGADWESSRINVAQEHFSWNFLRSRLLNFFKANHATGAQPKLLLATPPGELHEGGLIILAASMMLKGWRVFYLGVNLPLEDLAHATAVIAPDVVCLSSLNASTIYENWKSIERLNTLVAIGGPCVGPLNASKDLTSSRIHLIQGNLQSSLSQIEVLLQTAAR